MRLFIKVVFATLLVVVFAPTKSHSQSGPQEDLRAPLQQMSRSFEQLTREVSSSVVQIMVTGYAVHPGIVRNSADLVTREQGTGSGVILDSSGYIVTNAHVVEGAHRIQVVLPQSLESDRRTSILKRSGRLLGLN